MVCGTLFAQYIAHIWNVKPHLLNVYVLLNSGETGVENLPGQGISPNILYCFYHVPLLPSVEF